MIENKVNGKCYIGKTTRPLPSYFQEQVRNALRGRTNKPHLYNAIRCHGPSNFSVRPLVETTTLEQLNKLERACIRVFDSIKTGYNILPGGEGGVTYGFRGKKHSVESRKKIGQAGVGRDVSEETRQLHREQMLGNKHALGSKSQAGLPKSDLAKQHMKEAALRRWTNASEEERRKCVNSGTFGQKPTRVPISEIPLYGCRIA